MCGQWGDAKVLEKEDNIKSVVGAWFWMEWALRWKKWCWRSLCTQPTIFSVYRPILAFVSGVRHRIFNDVTSKTIVYMRDAGKMPLSCLKSKIYLYTVVIDCDPRAVGHKNGRCRRWVKMWISFIFSGGSCPFFLEHIGRGCNPPLMSRGNGPVLNVAWNVWCNNLGDATFNFNGRKDRKCHRKDET